MKVRMNQRLIAFFQACFLWLAIISCSGHPGNETNETASKTVGNPLHSDTSKSIEIYNLAVLHYKTFNYKEALELFDSAMISASHNKNFRIVANCLNELGSVERDLNNSSQARVYFKKAFELAIQHDLDYQAGVSLGNIANVESNADSAMNF